MAACECDCQVQKSKTKNDRKNRRKLSRLVGSLDKYEPSVRRLCEIGICCDVDAESAREFLWSHGIENQREDGVGDPSRTLSGNGLFTPACTPPVPLKGRQTYRMWKAMIQLGASPFTKSRLTYHPKTLHFLPLEKFNIDPLDFKADGLQINSITGLLHSFLQTFFPSLNIILEERFDIAGMNPISRIHERTNKKQYLVTDIYSRLHNVSGIDKKHYILGLTWTDLYPSEDLNFALGEALYSHNCAVLSFGRYEPQTFAKSDIDSSTGAHPSSEEFPPGSSEARDEPRIDCSEEKVFLDNCGQGFSCDGDGLEWEAGSNVGKDVSISSSSLQKRDDVSENKNACEADEDFLTVTGDLIWKLMRVSSHEVCHLFGLSHCVFFECAMNESKSVKEALEQPLQLCPICLRKLHRFLDFFDIPARYGEMLKFCRSVQERYPCKRLEETAQWLEQVLDFVSPC